MSRYDQDGDDDAWDEEYDVGDESAETVTCPNCSEEIYEDAQRCPYCEQYVTELDSKGTSQPTWVVVTAVIVLAMFIYFAVAPLFGELF